MIHLGGEWPWDFPSPESLTLHFVVNLLENFLFSEIPYENVVSILSWVNNPLPQIKMYVTNNLSSSSQEGGRCDFDPRTKDDTEKPSTEF